MFADHIMACINAIGDIIPPFFIFKNKYPDSSKYPQGSKICASEKSWINEVLFLQFLIYFQNHRQKIVEQKCVLLVNGHKSHVCFEASSYYEENNIELLWLPPQSSHRLQPMFLKMLSLSGQRIAVI